MKVRKCEDCRFASYPGRKALCLHYEVLVLTENANADGLVHALLVSVAREEGQQCGPEGKLFEARS